MTNDPPPDKISILFASSDPSDRERLRLGKEQREIRTALQSSAQRERFELNAITAARVADLSAALLQHRPRFLHFAGHGDRSGALVLEDDDGLSQPVQPQALADLLVSAGGSVECVVLNACHSARLAQALLPAAPCVVAMEHAIGDQAAINFSIGFYQALGNGRTPEQAFELGKALIAFRDLPQREIPRLVSRDITPAPLRPAGTRERLRLGIRSFAGHGQEMTDQADHLLALGPYFDGPHIRHATLWQAAILPELAAFLGAATASRRPLHLNLAALPSLAFASGYFLEAKGGHDILIRQRGLTGTADWRAASAPRAAEPLWAVRDSVPGVEGTADVALAVGITRQVRDDVQLFLQRAGIPVGRTLHASLGEGTAHTAVRDGAHAAQLAQSICQMIETRSVAERTGVLHLFIAAPNAVVFFLGQMARGLGRLQLYDHDLDARGVLGAYMPAFELPVPA